MTATAIYVSSSNPRTVEHRTAALVEFARMRGLARPPAWCRYIGDASSTAKREELVRDVERSRVGSVLLTGLEELAPTPIGALRQAGRLHSAGATVLTLRDALDTTEPSFDWKELFGALLRTGRVPPEFRRYLEQRDESGPRTRGRGRPWRLGANARAFICAQYREGASIKSLAKLLSEEPEKGNPGRRVHPKVIQRVLDAAGIVRETRRVNWFGGGQ